MLIVSQDKNVIININSIACIQTSSENIGNIEIILFNKIDNYNGLTVGEYKTEERAKEVLQEITSTYKEGKFLCKIADNEWQKCNVVYEMPEK